MKKKSFYEGYYSGFYNKAGVRMAKGDIMLNAKGDIVEKATGSFIYNAKGDIIKPAKGDINMAKGDINAAKGDINLAKGVMQSYYDDYYKGYYSKTGTRMAKGDINDAIGKGCFWYDLGYDSYAEYASDWGADALPNDCNGSDGKVLDTIDSILGLTERGVDIWGKIKGGTTAEAGAVDLDIKPSSTTPKKDNTLWYVAGGAIVLVIIILAVKK